MDQEGGPVNSQRWARDLRKIMGDRDQPATNQGAIFLNPYRE